MNRAAAALVLAVAGACALAACSGSTAGAGGTPSARGVGDVPATRPASSPSTASVPTTSQTRRLNARGAATTTTAKPLFAGTASTLSGAGAGVLLQLLDSGESLWAVSAKPDTSVMPPKLKPSSVQLRAPDGHGGLALVRTLAAQSARDEAVQVIAADDTAAGTAWLATPSTDLDHSSWQLRARDARTGMVRTLADSDALFRTRNLPPALDWPDVRLGAGGAARVAYWTAAVPDPTTKRYVTAILSRPVDDSTPLRTVAIGAFPRPVGDALYYVTQPEADGVAGRYAIHRRTGEADAVVRTGTLTATQTVTSFAADEQAMAWTVTDTRGTPAMITAVAGSRTSQITADATQAVLSLSGTRLAWSEQGGQVGDQDLVDLAAAQPRVALIARGGGCAQVSVAGDLAAWGRQQGAVCVLSVGRVAD